MKYCPFNILDLHMTWQKLANWDWLIFKHSEISKNNANNHNQNNKMKRKFVQCNIFYQTSDLNENAMESCWLFQEHFHFKTVASSLLHSKWLLSFVFQLFCWSSGINVTNFFVHHSIKTLLAKNELFSKFL